MPEMPGRFVMQFAVRAFRFGRCGSLDPVKPAIAVRKQNASSHQLNLIRLSQHGSRNVVSRRPSQIDRPPIGSLNISQEKMARPRKLSDEERRERKRLANLRYYYTGPTGDPRGRKRQWYYAKDFARKSQKALGDQDDVTPHLQTRKPE